MTDIFLSVLNMSITGSLIIAVVMLIRMFMKKLPKKYSYILWLIPAIRLLCPVSVSSSASLFNLFSHYASNSSMEYIPHKSVTEKLPVLITDAAPPDKITANTPVISHTAHTVQTTDSISAIDVIAWIWLIIAAAVIVYGIISYIFVYRKVKNPVKADGYRICSDIDTPFVFGIFRPLIYIPEGISDSDLKFILAHENTHIKRRDYNAVII